jgi:riboflavin biosynthesis pyrimidine reductase
MTTLKMNEAAITPSQQAVAKAAKTVVVTDAGGRKITLKKPSVLAQYDLIEVLEETAKNETYVAMVLPLLYVTDTDGDAVIAPRTKLQIRALIQRLGEDGVNAVMIGVGANFGGADVEGDKAAIKK